MNDTVVCRSCTFIFFEMDDFSLLEAIYIFHNIIVLCQALVVHAMHDDRKV